MRVFEVVGNAIFGRCWRAGSLVLLIAASGAASAAPAGWTAPPTGGANCRDAIQRNTDAINRAPQPANQVARYQYILAITADRLAILEKYCKADAVAYADRVPVQKLYDDTMRTCTQDQADKAVCKPMRTW